MESTTKHQAAEFLRRAKSVLIALPATPSTDAIAAGLGLYLALEKTGTPAKVVSPGFTLPANHSFLPKSAHIAKDVPSLRKFIITVDVSKKSIDELSYDVADGKLSIYLTPKGSMFDAHDVTTGAGAFQYDAIVTLDTANLEALGSLFDTNADFFYQTPVLNIDHSPANELYGQVNMVDLAATSTSELVFEVTQELKDGLLDETIATALLTGIISKTKSFRTSSVTPKSLTIASHLIASGARREEIVHNLYQSKSLATLKLWGRALARLKEARDGRLLWTALSKADFEKAGSDKEHLPGVIDELIVNSPRAEIIVVLSEANDGIHATISGQKAIDLPTLFMSWQPQGGPHLLTAILKGKTAVQVEEELQKLTAPYFQSTQSF